MPANFKGKHSMLPRTYSKGQTNNISKIKYCAFFDVDGTLINTRSMFSFAKFISNKPEFKNEKFRGVYSTLHRMLSQNEQREIVNRFYYRLFSGINEEVIRDYGKMWCLGSINTGGFYNASVIDRLNDHKKNGAIIVAVSGSSFYIIDYLMKTLGIDKLLCTVPEILNGIFTGEIEGIPCIGEGKKLAIRSMAHESSMDLDNCFAYGDDVSDGPMLESVGNGLMVETSQAYKDELMTLKERADDNAFNV